MRLVPEDVFEWSKLQKAQEGSSPDSAAEIGQEKLEDGCQIAQNS